ncbi:hypothetical protein ElyMa_005951600 [Elysia marginata]|uniref:Uncharacterized protein n=1 Tax=Elysia marginata TaxID=1093978 RepID=A0AAV4GDG0_9GAST|nr:hypothetical protein ElyMa_005951600 [Elysia marginata]
MPDFKALACDFTSFREWPQIGSLEWSVDPLRHPAMLLHWRVLSAVLARLSADDQAAFIRKYGPSAPRGTFRTQPATVASRRSNTKGGEKPRSRSRRSRSRSCSRSTCREVRCYACHETRDIERLASGPWRIAVGIHPSRADDMTSDDWVRFENILDPRGSGPWARSAWTSSGNPVNEVSSSAHCGKPWP